MHSGVSAADCRVLRGMFHDDCCSTPHELVIRVTASSHSKLSLVFVSPSAAGGGNEEWFERFFAECEILGCRIDYLATHDYHGETEVVMNRLEELYHRCLLFVSFQSF